MCEHELTSMLLDRLKESPVAWEAFDSMSPSHQREWLTYVMEAKREATRLGRLQKMIASLEAKT